MKFSVNALLNNRIILYIVAFLSLTSIFGYLMIHNYAAIVFFILVAFLTNYFSKNMILILGISLILTNTLAGISNFFSNKQEGFSNDTLDKNKCSSLTQDKCNVEGCIWNNNMCNIASATETVSVTESVKFDVANTQEKSHDDLEKMIGKDNVRTLSNETQNLLQQQDRLMNQMKDIGPLISEAAGVLQGMGSGNYLGVFKSLSSSLDGFYEKYPDSFPKDYKQQSASMKSMIENVSKLTQNSNPNN